MPNSGGWPTTAENCRREQCTVAAARHHDKSQFDLATVTMSVECAARQQCSDGSVVTAPALFERVRRLLPEEECDVPQVMELCEPLVWIVCVCSSGVGIHPHVTAQTNKQTPSALNSESACNGGGSAELCHPWYASD
jgi:hypothetical protein